MAQIFLSLSPEEQANKLGHIHESHMSRTGSALTKLVKELLIEDALSLQPVFDYLVSNPSRGISRIKYIVMHSDVEQMSGIMSLIGESDFFTLVIIDALTAEFQQIHTRRHRVCVIMKMIALLSSTTRSTLVIDSAEFFTFINYAGNLNRILFDDMSNEHFQHLLNHLVDLFINTPVSPTILNKQKDIMSILSKVLKYIPTFSFEKIQLAKTSLLPLKQFIESTIKDHDDSDYHYLELQLSIILKN